MLPSTLPRPKVSGALRGVVILLVLSVSINYIDRGNLSIAAPLLKDELGISASQLGILLSSFFWTYAACQILAGKNIRFSKVVGYGNESDLGATDFLRKFPSSGRVPRTRIPADKRCGAGLRAGIGKSDRVSTRIKWL